jgi:glycosyltransferase involved in cell wall biosynthesis
VPEASSAQAVAGLDIEPPSRIAVGRGSAFVLGGYCYHQGAPTRSLAVQVDGRRQAVKRFRMPRQDVFERLDEDDPARPFAFRSGFVAMPTLEAREEAEQAEVSLVLTLPRDEEIVVPVARMRLEPRLDRPAEAAGTRFRRPAGAPIAICMATYNPPPELLERQLDSIRAQTHANWICLISDDCSEPAPYERLRRATEADERFVLSRSERRLGFYGNFERALSMAPAEAEFVALCDQDDLWNPAKLERLLARIGPGVQLAYSDARVVDPDGAVIHPSYWTERRNNHTNFGSLLIANSVTGAASLFRRQLLDDALPFPPRLGMPFHDHWLAVVALAEGNVAYIDAPLYDYVQHEGVVIGHSTANRRPKPVRQHLLERLRNPGDGSRVAYYYNWYQQLLFAEVLRVRCWDRIDASKRRVIRRLLSADSGVVGIGWLLGRRVRKLWGRNETLDRELLYAYALLRRRAVALWTLGRRRPGRWLPRDASIPPLPAREDSA